MACTLTSAEWHLREIETGKLSTEEGPEGPRMIIHIETRHGTEAPIYIDEGEPVAIRFLEGRIGEFEYCMADWNEECMDNLELREFKENGHGFAFGKAGKGMGIGMVPVGANRIVYIYLVDFPVVFRNIGEMVQIAFLKQQDPAPNYHEVDL